MARLPQRLGVARYEGDEYYKKALDSYRKNQLEDALGNMNEAIKMLPKNPEYYAARGFFYLEDGVTDKAQADFQQALKLYPYEMLAHYGRGIIAYKDKNWDEALAHFKDAQLADPKRAETLYYLGLTYHRKGDNAAALPILEQAQAAFDSTNDKRRADANRWVRELQKLVGQQTPQAKLEPAFRPLIRRGGEQEQLPLMGSNDEE